MSSRGRPRLFPLLVALAIGAGAGIFGFTSAAGILDSVPLALALAVLVSALVSPLAYTRLAPWLDEAATSRGLKAIGAVLALAALVQFGRLAVFMVNPARVGFSSIPSSGWELKHSCVSAYYVAAKAAGETPAIYDDSLYSEPSVRPGGLRRARAIGPFGVDVYEYPPPFLVVPRALRLLAPDFLRFRMLWFGLSGAVVLLGTVLVARALGREAGTRALLLSPLIWASFPTLSAFQKGNVQTAVIAASMIAMLLFEKRRDAAGGAILAYVGVSKLFPGLLAIPLLVERRWRALALTALFGVAYVALTLADIGIAPYRAFLAHLPGLLGGEAFPAFQNPNAMAINYSVPGLVFKAKLFGVSGMTFAASKALGWAYTLVAAWASVAASRRARRDEEKPILWMGILILATLRSPFLPQAYAAFPPLWLVTLLAAVHAPRAKTLGLALAGWAALNVFYPLDWGMDPRALALLSALPQAVTVLVAVLALRRPRGDAPSGEPVPVAWVPDARPA